MTDQPTLSPEEIVEKYMYLVPITVQRMSQSLRAERMSDALESAGCIGLWQAAKNYNQNSKCNITNWLITRIRGSILDEFRIQSPLSRAYPVKFVPDPDADPANEARRQMRYRAAFPMCVHELLEEPPSQLMPQHGPADYDDIRRISDRVLNARQRDVINLYYRDGLTMHEIADRLGITEGRISQLHSAAIAILRSEFVTS